MRHLPLLGPLDQLVCGAVGRRCVQASGPTDPVPSTRPLDPRGCFIPLWTELRAPSKTMAGAPAPSVTFGLPHGRPPPWTCPTAHLQVTECGV